MKLIRLAPALLLMGCVTQAPKKLYVSPDKYICDIMVTTTWDGNYPVQAFEYKMEVGKTYTDQLGSNYMLVATEDTNVFAIKVFVPKP
jgi:hypothetical protein